MYSSCPICIFLGSLQACQIPSIVFWNPDKSSSSKSVRNSSASLGMKTSSNGTSDREGVVDALLLMADTLFVRLRRQIDEGGSDFPQPAKSELIVRLVYLLFCIHTFGGLTDEALNTFLGTGQVAPTAEQSKSRGARLHRNELGQLLFAAYPSAVEIENLPSTVTADILAKICRGCSFLGLTRKHLLVQEELIKMITISLQQARKATSADVGLHPAAGFAASSEANLGNFEIRTSIAGSENESNELLRGFLESFIDDLGLPRLPKPGDRQKVDDFPEYEKAKEAHEHFKEDQLIEVFNANSSLNGRSIGPVDIQIACLSSCMRLCEALNDYRGYLHYACYQLRNAVDYVHRFPHMMPPVALHEGAQHSIYHGIQRTVASAQQHLDSSIEAEYWDYFLVRDVSILMPDSTQDVEEVRMAKTQSTEAARGSQQGVFIHNPFNAVAKRGSKTTTIVAGESYQFQVLLQNPFAFATEIESIRLISNGVELKSFHQPVELSAMSQQQLTILATPQGEGEARIVGCMVKIRACREKFFPIFSDEGPLKGDSKFKTTQPGAGNNAKLPSTTTLSLDVIQAQPKLDMRWVSEPQDALVLLENEKSTLTVELHNGSRDAEVAFIHPEIKSMHSSHESTDSKALSRAEMHEIEWQAKNRPSARLLDHDTSQTWVPVLIGPQKTERISFEILGKPNLTGLEFVIHYRRSVDDSEGTPDKVFARKISRRLRVAIVPAIQTRLVGIIPYPDSAPDITARLTKHSTNQCLLRLEFQNRWSAPLMVRLSARTALESSAAVGKRRMTRGRSLRVIKSKHEFTLINEGEKNQMTQSTTVVHPTGPTERCTLLLPVPKIFVDDPHEQIPLSQQFIFDNRLSKADDMANRTTFWYGEKLSELIEGSWEDMETDQPGKLRRSGEVSVRGQKLSLDMVDVLKRSNVNLGLSISQASPLDSKDNPILRNYRPWVCEITIRNTSHQSIKAALFIEHEKLSWEPSGSSMYTPVRGFSPDLNGSIYDVRPGLETKVKTWALELSPGELCIRAQLHDVATGRSVATAIGNFSVPFQSDQCI
jgi:trafficking protein particle complex subunit 9